MTISRIAIFLFVCGISSQQSGRNTTKLIPYDGSCGAALPNDFYQTFLQAASSVNTSAVPWQAFVTITTPDHLVTPVCGGAVLDDRHVLTSASCVTREGREMPDPRRVLVTFGTRFLPLDAPLESSAASIGATQFILHERWSAGADLALISLAGDIRFNQFVRPICLPDPEMDVDYDFAGETNVFTAGWGTAFLLLLRPHLFLERIKVSSCTAAASASAAAGETTKDEFGICAVGLNRPGVCVEDRGGPLVALIDGVWRLIGVHRYPVKSCPEGAAFTRVSPFISWLRANGVTIPDEPLRPNLDVHSERGLLPAEDIFDLKSIFCVVVTHGGVGADGWNCRPVSLADARVNASQSADSAASLGGAVGQRIPRVGVAASFGANLVCGDRVIISKRDYKDALIRRKWLNDEPRRRPIILSQLWRALTAEGLSADAVVNCVTRPFVHEQGCFPMTPQAETFICNSKYVADKEIYEKIKAGT